MSYRPDYKHIWYFENRLGNSSGQEAPKLIGAMGGGGTTGAIGKAISPDIEGYTYVNVSSHFAWTLNKERQEVPRIILRETMQDQSALWNRAQVFFYQVKDVLDIVNPFEDHMATYKELYKTEDTGFYYDLPNITESYLDTGSNKFDKDQNMMEDMLKQAGGKGGSDSKIGGFFGGLGKTLQGGKILSDMAGTVRAAFGGGKGYYTEQPKFYQHGQNVRQYKVSFPLYNTGEWDDLVRNFQLVFMLVYQNLPNRQSRQLILPPAIYEVTVPGVSYSPYSYMSSVNIDFMGSRREMNVPIPFGDISSTTQVNVVVPEAYQVTLNISDLVGHTKNFMFENMKRKVNVTTYQPGE